MIENLLGNPLFTGGIGLLSGGGPSRDPVSFGQALSQGLKQAQEGVKFVDERRNNQISNALQLETLKVQQAHQRLAREQFDAEAAATAAEAERRLGLSEALGRVYPAHANTFSNMANEQLNDLVGQLFTAPESFTLAPGQRRYDSLGNIIVENPDDEDLTAAQTNAAALEARLGRPLTNEEYLQVFGASSGGTSAFANISAKDYTPESIKAFQDNLGRTGNLDYSLLEAVPTPEAFETSVAAEQGKGTAERLHTTIAEGDTAEKLVTGLTQIRQLMELGTRTGFGADSMMHLERIANFFGSSLDIKGVGATQEAFQAASARIALDGLGGSLGVGVSDADRQFIMDMGVKLSRTAAGNALILEFTESAAKGKINLRDRLLAAQADADGVISNSKIQEVTKKWKDAQKERTKTLIGKARAIVERLEEFDAMNMEDLQERKEELEKKVVQAEQEGGNLIQNVLGTLGINID